MSVELPTYNCAICVDDVHPEANWGGYMDDHAMVYMKSLFDEFGAKFTLFIPSNYHGKYPLSQYPEWVDQLNSLEYFELAAHGHLHETKDVKKYGECEFAQNLLYHEITDKLFDCKSEWFEVDVDPVGWRNPGWLCASGLSYLLTEIMPSIKYVALHKEHNHGMSWKNAKEIFGHHGINETHVSVNEDNTIMFQSHVNGAWNRNVWNTDNYNQLRMSLRSLVESDEFNIKFITLNELV